MRQTIFWLLTCLFLLIARQALAGSVEVSGDLDIIGTPGANGILFPDSTKQTTAGITSIEAGGGLTITSPGVVSIAPGGVGDAMLAIGISGSKIISGSISQSQVAPIRATVLNTGQLITYSEGDDGNLKYGAAVTAFSRFTDNGNGTVTDNLTSLIWLKNAECFGGQTWSDALAQAAGLANGACGLTDDSVAGKWRLPNRNELASLIDVSNVNPALPIDHPFTNVQSWCYWSSTRLALYAANNAWYVSMDDGKVFDIATAVGSCYVWPVRGGQ